jgi:hypothetical protein
MEGGFGKFGGLGVLLCVGGVGFVYVLFKKYCLLVWRRFLLVIFVSILDAFHVVGIFFSMIIRSKFNILNYLFLLTFTLCNHSPRFKAE